MMTTLESSNIQVNIANKVFVFDKSIKYEVYKNDSYRGIVFTFKGEGDGYINKDAKYDIVMHYNGWQRLIVNNKEGWKDLPFHQGTYRFLPPQIKVIEND